MENMTNWINSNSGLVITVSTLIYAVLTFFYVLFTWFMVKEMSKTREEETRPYIVMDFEINNKLIDIVIQNIGKTAAKDVTFSFNPSIETANREDFSSKGFISKGFSFFPPNKKFICFFDSVPEYFQKKQQFPYFEVTIKYKHYITNKHYNENYIIDLESHRNRTYVEIENKNIHDIANTLDEIKK